jgi:hypothetical protein
MPHLVRFGPFDLDFEAAELPMAGRQRLYFPKTPPNWILPGQMMALRLLLGPEATLA